MTDVELEVAESFERVFPVPVVSADWNEVLERAGAGHRHRTRRLPAWRVVAVAAAILVGALLVTPAFGIGSRLLDLIESGPAQPDVQTPVWSPNGRKIVFSSRRNGNWEIYVVNTDGGGQWNLTRNPGRDSFPAWSPDGRKIAFVGHRNDLDGVYVVNANGSDQRMLARKGNSPTWSPDGRKIAFTSGAQGIFVMNAGGSGHRRLTRLAGRKASLAWSPDGRKLAFLGGCGRGEFNFDLYAMNADGSGLRDVTQMCDVSDPDWSPDGRKIAFVSDDDVFVVNADGSGLRRLTRNPASDSAPAWSPDGRKIAFVRGRDDNYGVYVMNADGSRQLALGASTVGGRGPYIGEVAVPDDAPAWSPDGRRIAFVSDRDGSYRLYIINPDGSGERRLTERGRPQ
jgi:Tol biopolymer transport system component